jgi:HEAT repeat protein
MTGFFGALDSNQALQGKGATSLKTHLAAQLLSTVIAGQGDGFVVAVRLQNPVVQLEVDGHETSERAHTIATELGADIFAVVDHMGRVRSVLFNAGTDSLSQGFGRTLLALIQFVFPDDPAASANQWESLEEGPAGQYVAHYRAEAVAGGDNPVATFRKKKAYYITPPEVSESNEYEVSQVITPSGDLLARFDVAAGHLLSLDGTESDVTSIAGKTVARSETTLKLTYKSPQTLSEKAIEELRAEKSERERTVRPIALFLKRSKEEIENSIAAAKLGKDTEDSLLAQLAEAESTAAVNTDSTDLFLKFKALVQLHPESCRDLGRTLTKAEPKGVSMSVLAEALKAVGSPEAQNALADAIRARGEDWPALSKLIPMLALAGPPTEIAENTLKEIADHSGNSDIATTAKLSLGIMAGTLEKVSPERSARLVDFLISSLDSSGSPADKRIFLLVLGNAGSTRALPVISRFLNDPSPVLRAAAVSALRLCDSSSADDLLAKALASDADPAVRSQAAFSLSYRRMNTSTFEVQKRVFERDKDESLRLSLLNNLWKARQSFPEVVQIVKRASATDASKVVRQAATRLLATLHDRGADR